MVFSTYLIVLKKDSKYEILNSGKNILVRYSEIPKQTSTINRNVIQHLDSLCTIGVKQDDPVILLDDVITTGFSMKAGMYKLEQAGANVLMGIAFAKTSTMISRPNVDLAKKNGFKTSILNEQD